MDEQDIQDIQNEGKRGEGKRGQGSLIARKHFDFMQIESRA